MQNKTSTLKKKKSISPHSWLSQWFQWMPLNTISGSHTWNTMKYDTHLITGAERLFLGCMLRFGCMSLSTTDVGCFYFQKDYVEGFWSQCLWSCFLGERGWIWTVLSSLAPAASTSSQTSIPVVFNFLICSDKCNFILNVQPTAMEKH